MSKEIISTDRAPAAVGPYSQGVKTGNLLFVSGQIPLDPVTNQLVDGDVQVQTRQVLTNLTAVLNAAEASLDKVVKTTVFLTDMKDFPLMNEVYSEFFSSNPPARACVAVSALPKAASVEIEAIATL